MLWLPRGVLVHFGRDGQLKWDDKARPAPHAHDDKHLEKLIQQMFAKDAPEFKPSDDQLPNERLAIRLAVNSPGQLDYDFIRLYMELGGSMLGLEFLNSFDSKASQERRDAWRAEVWKFAESHRASLFDAQFMKWLLGDVVYCTDLIHSVWLTIKMQFGTQAGGRLDVRKKMMDAAKASDFLDVFVRDRADAKERSDVSTLLMRALLQQNEDDLLWILFDLTKNDNPELAAFAVNQCQRVKKDSKEETEKLVQKLAMFQDVAALWLMDYTLCEGEITDKLLQELKKKLGSQVGQDNNFWDRFGLVLEHPCPPKSGLISRTPLGQASPAVPSVPFYLGGKVKAAKLLKKMKKRPDDKKIDLLKDQWDTFLMCSLPMQREIMENCLSALKKALSGPGREWFTLNKVVTLLELCPKCEELQDMVSLEEMDMA